MFRSFLLPTMPKLYPELSQIALRQRHTKQYRVWTMARAIDIDGSGQVRLSDITAQAHAVNCKGLSPGSLRHILSAGCGLWWETYERDGERWLELRGLAQVCEKLGIHKLSGYPIYISWNNLRTLKSFRAICHASQFEYHFGSPISRRTLQKLTGRCGATQRRYEKMYYRSVRVRPNGRLKKEALEHGDAIPSGHRVVFIGGQPCLIQVLPNSYRATFARAPRGMIRNVNRFLSGERWKAAGGNPGRTSGPGTRHERIFYDDCQAARRRGEALDEDDQFFVRNTDHKTHDETGIYQRWSVANEHLFYE